MFCSRKGLDFEPDQGREVEILSLILFMQIFSESIDTLLCTLEQRLYA